MAWTQCTAYRLHALTEPFNNLTHSRSQVERALSEPLGLGVITLSAAMAPRDSLRAAIAAFGSHNRDGMLISQRGPRGHILKDRLIVEEDLGIIQWNSSSTEQTYFHKYERKRHSTTETRTESYSPRRAQDVEVLLVIMQPTHLRASRNTYHGSLEPTGSFCLIARGINVGAALNRWLSPRMLPAAPISSVWMVLWRSRNGCLRELSRAS